MPSTITDVPDIRSDDLTFLDANFVEKVKIIQPNNTAGFETTYLGNTITAGDLFFIQGSDVFLLTDNVYNDGEVIRILPGSTSLGGRSNAPSNDDITNATVLTTSPTSTNTASATAVLGEDLIVPPNARLGKTVWYSLTAPSAGEFSFSTFGSNFDTTLQLFEQIDAASALNYSNVRELATNDDIDINSAQNDISGLNSKLTYSFVQNKTYYIQVGGRRDDVGGIEGGDLILTITSGTNFAPVISGLTPTIVRAGLAFPLPDFQVADSEGDNITVTLKATNGVINGLADADGNATNGIQLSGSTAALNTQLAAATFTAAAGGSASIVVEATDGNASSGQKTLNLTVTVRPPFDPMPTNPTVTPNDQGGNTIAIADSSQLTEAQGTAGVDQVNFSGSQTLSLPSNIENVVLAGYGNSNVTGNLLDNTVLGNAGNNSIAGGAGSDSVSGGDGTDLIFGNQDADLVSGNQGADRVYGGQGADTAFGGEGDDVVFGDRGNDLVLGNLGDDLLLGGMEADSLYGGQGSDSLYGGQGDDILTGDLGDDALSGDLGADRYVFGQSSGQDLIVAFNQGEGDRISLQGQTYTVGSASNGDVLLTLSGGGTVELRGVQASAVNASFFA